MVLPWVPAVAFTLAPSLGGFLSSRYALGEGLRWYASLQKPWWHPPHWMLGPIWGTLYSAMGYVGLGRAGPPSPFSGGRGLRTELLLQSFNSLGSAHGFLASFGK